MNSGPITYRYAKALLKFVQENGSGDKVYSQAVALVRIMDEVPKLARCLADAADVTMEKKISLLQTALGGQADQAIVTFMKMVSTNRRMEYFLRMLWAFVEQYRQANNIKVGSLVTATQMEGLKECIENRLNDSTGAQVHLEENINPDIIGGFVFELDGLRLDASVQSSLARIRSQLVESDNRIV